MKRTIGVLATRHIWVGAVEDHDLKESIVYPSPGEGSRTNAVVSRPAPARCGGSV